MDMIRHDDIAMQEIPSSIPVVKEKFHHFFSKNSALKYPDAIVGYRIGGVSFEVRTHGSFWNTSGAKARIRGKSKCAS